MDISIIQRSNFTALDDMAIIVNDSVVYMASRTSREVKKAIEMMFFGGRSIINDFDANDIERNDALIINFFFGLQMEYMADTDGNQDWKQILKSYDMPQEYKYQFQLLQEEDEKRRGMITEREFDLAMGNEYN